MTVSTSTQQVAQPEARPDPAVSDAAAAAMAAQLQNLDKRHVGAAMSKLISASIGDICVVMAKSPAYKFHTLADIEWLVLPAVLSGQFFVGAYASVDRGHTAPAAVVTWARVSDEVDRRLATTTEPNKRLKPEEWISGDHYWLIDVAGDAAVVDASLRNLAVSDLKGKIVKIGLGSDADGVPPVTTLSALLETVPRPRGVA
jgi:hemolysin-activating ACP:hemolysin acyltransferase